MTNKKKVKKGFYYYCLGLNSKEIGKLLDVSYRTVQNWMKLYKWKINKTPQPIKKVVFEMSNNGVTYNEIANKLNISRSTVSNWIKQQKTKT